MRKWRMHTLARPRPRPAPTHPGGRIGPANRVRERFLLRPDAPPPACLSQPPNAYSVEFTAAEQAGDNRSLLLLRQLIMRCPPGRTPLQSVSASLLHSRAIFSGSVRRFLAWTCSLNTTIEIAT